MTHLPDSDLRELEGLVEKATGVLDIEIGEMRAEGRDRNAATCERLKAALPSLIADLREMRERVEWRSIESAPRDEAVLLYGPGDWSVGVWWCGDLNDGPCWLDDNSGQVITKPTHWMPLPDAPARIKELEGKT